MGQTKATDVPFTQRSHFTSGFAQVTQVTCRLESPRGLSPDTVHSILHTPDYPGIYFHQVCEKEKTSKLLKSSEDHQILELKTIF